MRAHLFINFWNLQLGWNELRRTPPPIDEDADFAPDVRYIQKKTGTRVIQAYFKRHGDELRNACWEHLFLDDLMTKSVPGETDGSITLEAKGN